MSDDLVHDEFATDQAPDSSEPVTPSLAGEVKFGVAVIGLLLLVFAGVVYWKLGAPGVPWGNATVVEAPAAGGQETQAPREEAATEPTAAQTADALAQPVHVPPRMDAVDPFNGASRDRYVDRQVAAVQVPEVSEPAMPDPTAVGEAAERYAHDAGAVPADPYPSEPATLPQEQSGHIEKVAATAADPFRAVPDQQLPDAPPRDGGPLIATSERERSSQAGDEKDRLPSAANEPTLAEPRDAPYGREASSDRYSGDARQTPSKVYGESGQQPGSGRRGASAAQQQWNATETDRPRALRGAGDEVPSARTAPRANVVQSDEPPPAERFATPPDNFAGPPAKFERTSSADGTYIVEPNDSFWSISQKVYGTGGYFKAIQRHNRKPGSRAAGLSIGEKILVPPADVLEQKYPDLCPKRRGASGAGDRTGQAFPASSHGGAHLGRVYVVQEGDTLFDIAKYELGKASRWAEIYDLNRQTLGDDHDYVAPGTRLILPDAGAASDALTSRPATQYQR
ncbi:MAG: LysM peptidoglycan-binding domain-containing protein [Planctomycetia bacterium]|nr:LysM peptidoglycan-binding domain-containing protein [Planctomycetia bacterium]